MRSIFCSRILFHFKKRLPAFLAKTFTKQKNKNEVFSLCLSAFLEKSRQVVYTFIFCKKIDLPSFKLIALLNKIVLYTIQFFAPKISNFYVFKQPQIFFKKVRYLDGYFHKKSQILIGYF